ncbi:MAG: GIY-YIG nuclease family protein [Planctomycetaceae bacterium]|nr:GIY-YIG nuclease family protein [Planctomycetaceae bacterium]
MAYDLKTVMKERSELKRQLRTTQEEVEELRDSLLQLCDERDVMEAVWEEGDQELRSTKCVDAEEAAVFGRGSEWVYAYTFPAHEQLAFAKRLEHFPIKVGMSTQENVVHRVHQQVAGTSTAISERATLRLVFRVNEARQFEEWLHQKLSKAGRKASESVGVEWYRTNPTELERLFRSYVLTKTRASRPIAHKKQAMNDERSNVESDVS